MKDYATMTAAEWAAEFNLDMSFSVHDALAGLVQSLKYAHKGSGYMVQTRDNSHALHISLRYTDKKGYGFSLCWNLDKREVRVEKEKRYYPNGVDRYEDYCESYHYVTLPESNWLIQRVLKAFDVRAFNDRYNRFGGRFLTYCYNWRKDLLR